MKQDSRESTDAEKLKLLQAAECSWRSLEETRRCVLCEETFTGRQVRMIWDQTGVPALRCATPGCPTGPGQWVHPGNPLLSEEAWRDWVRLLDTLCDEPIRSRAVFGIRKGQMAAKKRRALGSPNTSATSANSGVRALS